MSHVTYKWVMSHICTYTHVISRTLVTHKNVTRKSTSNTANNEWVLSHMHEACHTSKSHVIHKLVMSHIWMSHVTYEWVMSHMNESCHIWMSQVMHKFVMSHVNESCQTWIRVISLETEACHVSMTHITYEYRGQRAQTVTMCINTYVHMCIFPA